MKHFLLVVSLFFMLGACSPGNATPAPQIPTLNLPTPGAPDTALPENTSAPIPTLQETPLPPDVLPTTASETLTPGVQAPTPVAVTSGDGTLNDYLDDRSTPQQLLRSWANSINRHEFLRTYSYWEPGAPQLQPFPKFEQGYANTASVQLTLGTVHSDAGAGQIYYPVPVTLHSQLTDNTTQTFVGCYTLHQSQPGNFGAPPFRGLAIMSAEVRQVANNADTAAMLANACPPANGLQSAADVPSPQTDLSASHYIDDHSDGVSVLRSLFNAVNRRELVRAYAYWEPGSPQLASFDQFQQGYANTASVQLTTGTQTTDAGAGQFYYNVPLILVATTTGNTTQTFTGCYTLHLSNPSIQGTPPFQPLAIRSANLSQVPNSPAPAMPACP